jgi:branched-chain amino acid transport system substrate-binding protein
VVGKFGADASEGLLCPTQWAETLSYSDPLMGTAAEYDAAFKKAYPEYTTVPYQTAQATAAVMVWADAFGRAKSADTEDLRDALAATDMKTFYGAIKFSEAGNNIAKPMVLRQIQDGEYNVVAPSKWASSELRYPRQPKN